MYKPVSALTYADTHVYGKMLSLKKHQLLELSSHLGLRKYAFVYTCKSIYVELFFLHCVSMIQVK